MKCLLISKSVAKVFSNRRRSMEGKKITKKNTLSFTLFND